MKFYSVTQVLQPYADFSGAKQEHVEAGAIRGTNVHMICGIFARGLWCDVPDEYRGYIDSFMRFFDHVETVHLIEPELKDDTYGFFGHPDYVLQLKGDSSIAVPDIKTSTSAQRTWMAQCAAYRHLAEGWVKKQRMRVKGVRAFPLMLKANGSTPRIPPGKDDSRDLAAFFAALGAYRYFDNHKTTGGDNGD